MGTPIKIWYNQFRAGLVGGRLSSRKGGDACGD